MFVASSIGGQFVRFRAVGIAWIVSEDLIFIMPSSCPHLWSLSQRCRVIAWRGLPSRFLRHCGCLALISHLMPTSLAQDVQSCLHSTCCRASTSLRSRDPQKDSERFCQQCFGVARIVDPSCSFTERLQGGFEK
ncbi:hypothetical protein SISSUDRAFT_431254 [Sistotremastrum suecicum HHB10207 ss-3]|uniref:Uncharacterized protein n=1 Tax=Sistotremastrum suecicum HHB10207 ss-3 TaxID=1314776 RepID=A0A165YH99_9AGAM|nr:hypothetical protein SISSUDRAFT_431254 [Sistotremastrum suecicum HHB10207 ss-3]